MSFEEPPRKRQRIGLHTSISAPLGAHKSRLCSDIFCEILCHIGSKEQDTLISLSHVSAEWRTIVLKRLYQNPQLRSLRSIDLFVKNLRTNSGRQTNVFSLDIFLDKRQDGFRKLSSKQQHDVRFLLRLSKLETIAFGGLFAEHVMLLWANLRRESPIKYVNIYGPDSLSLPLAGGDTRFVLPIPWAPNPTISFSNLKKLRLKDVKLIPEGVFIPFANGLEELVMLRCTFQEDPTLLASDKPSDLRKLCVAGPVEDVLRILRLCKRAHQLETLRIVSPFDSFNLVFDKPLYSVRTLQCQLAWRSQNFIPHLFPDIVSLTGLSAPVYKDFGLLASLLYGGLPHLENLTIQGE